MFHTIPAGMGVCSGFSKPTERAPPRANGPSVRPHTPAMVKLYPIVRMPARPTSRTIRLRCAICSARRGPSSSTSYQWAGAKFSSASSSSPSLLTSALRSRNPSAVQIGSAASETPKPYAAWSEVMILEPSRTKCPGRCATMCVTPACRAKRSVSGLRSARYSPRPSFMDISIGGGRADDP